MMPRDPQTKPPGSFTMHRSRRHTLALGPEELDIDVDTPWDEDDQMKCPQEFRDLFHPNLSEYQSAQEEQLDSLPEYTIGNSGDESDDVVGYDLTNGCYTTRTGSRPTGTPRSTLGLPKAQV